MNIINANLKFRDNYETRSIDSINKIILHHSASSVASAEDIHRWHLNNGWAGAGYQFLVRKDGSVYSMRPVEWVGAHCVGQNSSSIGVCFEGNFEEETMGQAQINAGKELVSYLKETYGIETVGKHNDYDSTSCPGCNFPFDEIKEGQTFQIRYKAHIQNLGWSNWTDAGTPAGTTGESLQMEAIIIEAPNIQMKYRAHVQDIGWMDFVNQGEVAGTTGQGKRLEALEIQSSVPLKVSEHIEGIGWLPASVGYNVKVGTEGKSLRMEAIKIELA